MPSSLPRLAVFISGSGRTLVNIHDHVATGGLPATIPLVVASRQCSGCDRARERGLETRIISGEIPAATLAALLREHRIDFIALAGYLKHLPIPPGFEHRIINIHPALLPSFGGPGMYGHRVHEAVLAAGCKVSGCTVHLCDDQYDHGPIVLQRTCPVHDADTPDTLAARVFDLETEVFPAALRLLVTNRIKVDGRRAHPLPEGGGGEKG